LGGVRASRRERPPKNLSSGGPQESGYGFRSNLGGFARHARIKGAGA